MSKLLTIKDYLSPIEVPKKLLSGINKPDLPAHSPLLREWYEEQVDYVLNGITINGKYYNPFLYHYLNFFYFPVQRVDKNGKPYLLDEYSNPLFSRIDEYICDKFWEAATSDLNVALMGSRGIGKSYIAVSILCREYNFMPNSHSVVSASIQKHVDTSWAMVENTLSEFNLRHPALRHKTVEKNDENIVSGEKVKTEFGEEIRGYHSRLEKVLYGKDANKTRSMRPSKQLIEEFGAFKSTGKGNLKEVLTQSRGSNIIGGGIVKNFVMMLGTGGSVENDHAKEVFHHPDAYNLLAINEWDGLKTGIFIPVQYKFAGTWEKNGVPDVEKALEIVNKKRNELKASGDAVSYQNYLQEFPQNLREVFLRKGSNRFNQEKIASQLMRLDTEIEAQQKVKRGTLVYEKDSKNHITGVKFVEDGVGPINIIEEVEKSDNGSFYEKLYVMGVDSIDMGIEDTTDSKSDNSKLAALVKKRYIDGKVQSSTGNIYVAWYNNRSYSVRDDYEQILLLALYYRAKINLEYTRVGVISFFREKGFEYMFMKRPTIALGGDSSRHSNLIGTPATSVLIEHQDNKIMEYINENCEQLFVYPLLEQLRDYVKENRRPFDLVVAMGLCELADEDYVGVFANKEKEYASSKMKLIGYYTDKNGIKRYGTIPDRNSLIKEVYNMNGITWIDADGKGRFDEDYLKSLRNNDKE